MEAFCYLRHKLSSESLISSNAQKQTLIMYFDTLGMEARTNYITKHHIHLVTQPALSILQQMLGTGVGLGLTKRKPTKKSSHLHCTVGCFLMSVEVGDDIPDVLLANCNARYYGDSVEFLYTEESRQLTCTVRHTKIIINSHNVVTSRLWLALVHEKHTVAGAYVGANFHYNGELMTILRIRDDFTTCKYLTDDFDSGSEDVEEVVTLELPLQLAHELVASFGR